MVTEQVPDSPEAPVVTEPSDAPAVAPEGQVAADEATEQQPEAQVDWEARFTESQSKLESTEAALNSLKGNALRDAEIRGQLDEVKAELQGNREAIPLLVNAINSGQSEGVVEGLTEIQQRTTAAQHKAAFHAEFGTLSDDLRAIEGVANGEGQLAEFDGVRRAWNEIGEAGDKGADIGVLRAEAYKTTAEALSIRAGLDREAHKEELSRVGKSIDSAKETAAAAALEDAGVYNTDVGTAPAQPGPPTLAVLLSDAEMEKTKTMSQDQLAERGEQLKAAMERESGT